MESNEKETLQHPKKEILSIQVDKLASDEKAAVKRILTVIEDYTDYESLDDEIKKYVRMTVLAQLATLYNKFLGVLEGVDRTYKFRRMERRFSVPPKASSTIGQ